MTPAARPERAGRILEDALAAHLEASFARVGTLNDLYAHDVSGGGVFMTQAAIGQGIYGKDRRVDFLVRCSQYPDGLVVQAKWQAASGSVDEKYPYEVLCIEASKLPTVIVLDGGGASQGAEEWLKSQVTNQEHLVAVVDQGGFTRLLRTLS